MAKISLHEYCEQIESIIEQGLHEEAVAHGQHILKQYPKHVATYRLLGRAMLEADRDEEAFDMFHRVLGSDPEDLVAWVGTSEIHNRRDELDAAVWHLERAFEVASDSEAGIVEEELRHLYGRRDGVEPEQVQLTRGALARLYLKGDLLSRAIREFRALLAEQPERTDLSAALAEALWRNGQRLEAVEVCQQVLDKHPYSLKANLILGEIWASSGREEGQAYLRRAEALDPENKMAQELFGADSPLPVREVSIVPLEYEPSVEEKRPAWMADLETVPGAAPPQAEREAPAFDVTAGIEAPIEIPSWLEELGEEEIAPSAPVVSAEPPEERIPEEAVPGPEEEIPEWLAGLREGLAEEGPEEVGEEELEEVAAEEVPEWLVGLDIEPTAAEEEAPEPLAELDVEAAGEEAPPSAPPTELPEDWLDGLREQIIEEGELPEEPALPTAEEAPMPPWLEGEEMPSGEDALAWLEQLTAGKEEELEALAEEEAEARLADIMGRPEPAEAPSEVTGAPPMEEVVAPPIGEAPAPPTEEPVAAVEEIPPVEEAAPAAEELPAPAWLEGEEMPSGEEALAWLEQLTAGKEAELEALAEEEAEARLADIMGRPKPAEAPSEVAGAPPAEAAAEVAEAPPIEEAPVPPTEEPVAAVEEVRPVEEAAPAAKEIPAPSWLEGEEIPSGEEALAWLEQLTAGKEAELEALAHEEAEARLAEIMGRPKPAEAPSEVAGAPPAEAAAEVAEAPPIEEAVPGEPGAPPIEAPTIPPVEEPFGWTAFGEPEAPAPPVTEVVEAPPVEEAAPPERPEVTYAEAVEGPPPPEEAPPAEEVPTPEIAPPIEEARWGAEWEAPAEAGVAPMPVVEEVPGVTEMEAPTPIEKPAAAVEEAPAVEAPVIEEAYVKPLDDQRAYVKEHRRDYEAWLALARALWQAGERQEALEAYSRVIRGGKLLDGVTTDMEEHVEEWPDPSVQRVLGDTYMKDGQLQKALDIYRRALETL